MPYLLALTILLLPTYALKFTLLGLPLNLLMVWIFFVWFIFGIYIIYNKKTSEFISSIKNVDKKTLILISLFFLAGLISLFVPHINIKKLGQFLVLFIQPISLFFILRYISKQNPKFYSLIINSCYLLLALMGLWSLIQYFTLFSLPLQYWGNAVEPKRALGFFGHPNFYSLFSAPLLAYLVPDVLKEFSVFSASWRIQFFKNFKPILWIIGAIGLVLSLSRAGWLGLGFAIMLYLFVAADKKIRKLASVIIIVMVIIVFFVPNLRYRLLLPFHGEKSAVSRVSLWQTGAKGIKESPLTGLGLTGFAQNWQRLNTDPGLATDSHNFPHNIFLNFWVETGLLGLLSFFGLVGLVIFKGLKNKQNTVLFSTALFLVAMITQGLIDNPYFKNDLAILFWIIFSFI